MELLNNLFYLWINSPWYMALLLSLLVNSLVYVVGASVLSRLVAHLTRDTAEFIDDTELAATQVPREVRFGLLACAIFAVTSLASRSLFVEIWPSSLWQCISQMLVFAVFYETYSYFVHRLLHMPWLRRIHGVHHSSRRVTPWSAYSVHPFEALLIGASAPLFMVLWPMSLSVILWYHIAGMLFTMLLHSNIKLAPSWFGAGLINHYTLAHALHHKQGHGNFGFINAWWDRLLRTQVQPQQ